MVGLIDDVVPKCNGDDDVDKGGDDALEDFEVEALILLYDGGEVSEEDGDE